jgi:hypothetical protein
MIENAINITHHSVSQGVTAYYRDAHCFAIAPMQLDAGQACRATHLEFGFGGKAVYAYAH